MAIAAFLVVAVSLAGCAAPAAPSALGRPGAARQRHPGCDAGADLAASLPPPGRARAGQPTVLLAAGDIGRCDSTHDDATGALVASLPGVIATLGDTAYEDGTTAELKDCFGGSWGAVKDRIRFAVTGNHDMHTDGGAPMQAYMGSAATRDGHPWFSDDLGAWHVVVLDGNCGLLARQCSKGSDQATWLRRRPRRERRLVHGRAAPPAAVQQRRSTGTIAAFGHCGTRSTGAVPTSCSTATTTTTSVSTRRTLAARRRRRAASWRSRRHRRGPARGVQGPAAELAGADRRHLRGAGAHALGRLMVVAFVGADGSTHDEASGICH